jgi:ubiquinone/menaquinone biosynthesis C-methylase UbiE
MGDAIGYHSEKAAELGRGHDLLSAGDHFASPFVYGRWRIRRALEALIPAPTAGAALVDVGCGTGDELALFGQRGYDVTGVEPAEGMRAEALRRHPELAERLLGGTAQAVPMADGVADVVLSVEVLRYIPALDPVVREVRRVLRVGGSWVFTVTPPTNWTLGPLLNWLRCKGVPLPHIQAVPQYWHRATYLRSLLSREGFSVEDVVPANYIDFPSMVLCSLSPSLGRRWCRAIHPLWSFMENHRLLPWAAGYYVVRAVRNG